MVQYFYYDFFTPTTATIGLLPVWVADGEVGEKRKNSQEYGEETVVNRIWVWGSLCEYFTDNSDGIYIRRWHSADDDCGIFLPCGQIFLFEIHFRQILQSSSGLQRNN